ncbi:Cyclin-B2-2 [Capsicum chinense]|nr:Cyclin-B2-2 [Capsicum chinense]
MMEEIDRIDEEIEIEDTEDWSVVDIDSSDKKNKLIVVEYIDEIYAYYKKSELSLLLSALLVCPGSGTQPGRSIHLRQESNLKCSKLMIFFLQKAAVGKLTGVLRKYICLNMAMLQDVNQFFSVRSLVLG